MNRKSESTIKLPLSEANSQAPKRRLGCAKGKIWIADDFDDPLPDELLKAFNEGPIEPPA